MFLLNSRLGRFIATSSRFTCESLHANEAHLLPKLRCHFAEFLNERSLKHLRIFSLPTCVSLRYEHQRNSLEVFLGSMGSASLRDKSLLIASRSLMKFRICLESPPTGLNRDIQHPDGLPFYVTPLLITLLQWYRNINLFPITYACRPRLRVRLTLRRLALLRKP